jgi:hypothetical protein
MRGCDSAQLGTVVSPNPSQTGPSHAGTMTPPTTPFEPFVFGRGISGRQQPWRDCAEKAGR